MTQEKHKISELLTLLAATEYLYKQGTADHVPLDQRYYHPEGRHIGPRKGRFSIIGVEIDPHGNPLGQLVPALAPGMENESVRTWIERDPEAQHVLNTLSQYGNPYVVGGGVRDALLGVPSKDVDIEVYGLTIDELSDIVQKDFGGKQDQVGKIYGVFKVGNFDISLPRTETKVGDKHTDFDVEPNPDLPPELAARRRDFTINALMYDYKNDQVLDFFGGIQDLEAKRIKHVSPETFVEDPLRVYRAAQFAARFDFSIDPSTIELARSMDLSEISNERVFGEFEKLLLKSSTPSTGMQALDDMGVLDAQFPEISALKNTHQRSDFHAEGDVFTHTKMTLDKAAEIIQRFPDQKDKTIIMLAALCHDLGKATTTTPDGRAIGHEAAGVPITEEFLSKLTNDRDILTTVPSLVENHLKPLQFHRDGASDAAFRRLINKHGTEYLNLLSAVSEADVSGRLVGYPDGSVGEPGTEENVWFRDKVKQVSEKAGGLKGGKIAPLITGKDLKNLGLKEGKELGSILRDVQKRQEEGEITSADEALDYVSNNYQLPYQLPEYDMSWDAFTQNYPHEIKFQTKEELGDEEWEALRSQFKTIKADDEVFAYITSPDIRGLLFFSDQSAENIQEKIVQNLFADDSYDPPRRNKIPGWVADTENAFPDIPESANEIYWDDLPGFYSTEAKGNSNSYGKALFDGNLSGSAVARKLVKRAEEKTAIITAEAAAVSDTPNSEHLTDIWSPDDDAPQKVEKKLRLDKGSITQKQLDNVAKVFARATQESLVQRGLPEKFYVFRGGALKGSADTPTSASLEAEKAVIFASPKHELDPPFYMYEVSRDDVLLDVGAVVKEHREQELILRTGALENARKVILPQKKKHVGDFAEEGTKKWKEKNKAVKKSDDLPELLTLLTATEFLFKQGVTPSQEWTTGFVPPEKRFYHLEGTHKGPRGGQFSIIGTEVDQHGASLQQSAQSQPPGPHDISELPMPPISDLSVPPQVEETLKQWDEEFARVEAARNRRRLFDKYNLDLDIGAAELLRLARAKKIDPYDALEMSGEKIDSERKNQRGRWFGDSLHAPLAHLGGRKNQGGLGYIDIYEQEAKDARAIAAFAHGQIGEADEVRGEYVVSPEQAESIIPFWGRTGKPDADRESAEAAVKNLPPVEEGKIRLFRGESPDTEQSQQGERTLIEIPDSYSPGQFNVDWDTVDEQMLERDIKLYPPEGIGKYRGTDFLYKERLFPTLSSRHEYLRGYNSQEALPLMDHPDSMVAQQAFLRYKASSSLGSDFINYFAENLSMPKGDPKEFHQKFPQSRFFNEVVTGLRNSTGDNPTVKVARIVDELYSNTKFATIHRLAKESWETDSTGGAFSWLLQKSVGEQFDGNVQYFRGSTDEQKMDRAAENAKEELDSKWREDELGAKPTQEDIDEYVRVHKALSRWMLDAAFPDTDTLTVYRGTTVSEVNAEGGEETLIGAEVDLQSNPLTSWSLKPHVAFKFAAEASDKNWLLSPQAYELYEDEMRPREEPASTYDKWLGKGWGDRKVGPQDKANEIVILKSEISKDNIFSHFGSYSYHGNENEIMGINSPDNDVQIWDYRHEAHQMAMNIQSPFAKTWEEQNAELPANIQSYEWTDWAKEWGREEGSVHPRLWSEMSPDEKLSVDSYAEIDEE